MLKVAVTGNIASGKTAVQKILEQQNFKVIDTDLIGHKLLEELQEIKSEFASYDIFDESGNIIRSKLGQIVFSDTELKTKLEKIIHPEIEKKIIEFFDENKNEKMVFVSIPLLFETGMQNLFDKIVLIYTDNDIRRKRLIARNNYSVEYANLRMNSQMSQDGKIGLSDYVVYNNGSVGDLEKSVIDILSKLCK